MATPEERTRRSRKSSSGHCLVRRSPRKYAASAFYLRFEEAAISRFDVSATGPQFDGHRRGQRHHTAEEWRFPDSLVCFTARSLITTPLGNSSKSVIQSDGLAPMANRNSALITSKLAEVRDTAALA